MNAVQRSSSACSAQTSLPVSQRAHVVLLCRLAKFVAAGSLAHSSSMYKADQGSLTSSVYCTDVAGGHRTCTCAALGQGAQLVQVSRQLFMSFVMARPRTLQIYLHKVSSICCSL